MGDDLNQKDILSQAIIPEKAIFDDLKKTEGDQKIFFEDLKKIEGDQKTFLGSQGL